VGKTVHLRTSNYTVMGHHYSALSVFVDSKRRGKKNNDCAILQDATNDGGQMNELSVGSSVVRSGN
jgi:hypothetical protein